MSAYRDLCNPSEAHVVVLDRVRLEFGADGVLSAPDAEQLATLTATALRRERFVAVDAAPSVAAAAPETVADVGEASASTADAGAGAEVSAASAVADGASAAAERAERRERRPGSRVGHA